MRLASITKPGIIFGNLVTACGGYFLGAQGHINFSIFFLMLVGISLIVASGCVFNNVIDRDIDQLMERTKNRLMAQGLISEKMALLLAVVLGVLGFLVLYFGVNSLAVIIAAVGLFVYVVVYSLWLKRASVFGTAIGGISGAVPPIVGYVAATNQLNMGALLLFLILFFWQLPHSYSIAICRLKDYAAASIPVLPVKKGVRYTKITMPFYIAAFTIAALMPTVFGYAGWVYFFVALCLGGGWFLLSLKGFFIQDDVVWARKMFLFSIVNITLLCVLMV